MGRVVLGVLVGMLIGLLLYDALMECLAAADDGTA